MSQTVGQLTQWILDRARAAHKPSGEPCFEEQSSTLDTTPCKLSEDEYRRRLAAKLQEPIE